MRAALRWTGGTVAVIGMWISGLVFFAIASAVFVAILVGIGAAIDFLRG